MFLCRGERASVVLSWSGVWGGLVLGHCGVGFAVRVLAVGAVSNFLAGDVRDWGEVCWGECRSFFWRMADWSVGQRGQVAEVEGEDAWRWDGKDSESPGHTVRCYV